MVAGGPWHSLPCRHITPISASAAAWSSPLCLCVCLSVSNSPFLVRTPFFRLEPALIWYNWWYLQRPYVEIKSHSWVLGEHEFGGECYAEPLSSTADCRVVTQIKNLTYELPNTVPGVHGSSVQVNSYVCLALLLFWDSCQTSMNVKEEMAHFCGVWVRFLITDSDISSWGWSESPGPRLA